MCRVFSVRPVVRSSGNGGVQPHSLFGLPETRRIVAAMRVPRFALGCALTLASCVLSPENGEAVASDGVVSFWGQGTSAGQVFNVQSSATQAGPFTTLATVSTESTPTTLGGSSVYEWRVDVAIPSWTDLAGCEQEAFVRATTGPYNALTFDDGNGLECILAEYFGGMDLFNAALECQSDDAPIARITRTVSSAHVGNVVISTQADADALMCVGTIEGSLSVVDNPAAPSISLPNLLEVTGDVDLVYSRDPSSVPPYPTIREIDLPQLTTIGGSLSADYPGLGGDISDLDLHLENVSSVGGDVTLTATTFNLDLAGLDGLTTIPGDLTVVSQGSDYTAYGWLGSLTSVGGDLYLEAGNTSTGLWSDLESVGGDLTLQDALLPPGTNNFAALQTVGGDLSLLNLDAIAHLALPVQFPSLLDVGGTVRLEDLSNFEYLAIGDAAAGLDVGAMDLDGNSLEQLEPTHWVVGSGGTISITNDSTLSTCQVDAFAATQGTLGWVGTLVNTGNTGC